MDKLQIWCLSVCEDNQRREFRQKFDVPPFDVPGELAFCRIIKRFNTTNSTVPKSKKEDGGGRPMTGRSPENIATIRQSITQAGDQSISVLSVQIDIPETTVQRILRRVSVQILSSLFLISKSKRETVSATGCCQNVRISHNKSFGLWSDEKNG